jgi:tetratricopeptide (TPR) repeat protein
VTKDYVTRDDTWIMKIPVAPEFPAPVRWYAEAFDDLQFWLIEHHVCMRHQEHKTFYEFMSARLPARSLNVPALAGEHPIAAFQSVGVPGWVFPKVAILDAFGLNDYVIARNKERPRHFRYMAHDRIAPQGYLESFSLNYGMMGDQSAGFIRREYEMTTDEIKTTEQFWIDRIVHGSRQPFSYSMLNRIGESLTRTKREDSALVFLRQARNLDSSQSRADVNLAIVFAKKNVSDSALYYLHKALTIEPDNALIVTRIGRVLAGIGYDRAALAQGSADSALILAERYLKRGLSLDPQQAEAIVELAAVYIFVNRVDSSVAYFKMAEALPHPPPEELRVLGDRYVFRQQRDLALQAYRLAIKNGLSSMVTAALIRQYSELSDWRQPGPDGR